MNNPASAFRENRGFSLIEALIAAALFAIITLGIMPVFVKSSQDTSRNRNYLHFNGGLQAIMDELTVKKLGSGTPAMLTAGWHVFNNSTDWTTTSATDTNVPKAVVDLFRGTGTSTVTDKMMQNKLLAQAQYRVGSEYGRTRVDIRIYYFPSTRYVKSMAGVCSGVSGACDDTFPVLGAAPTAPPSPPAHLAVLSGSDYIDLP